MKCPYAFATPYGVTGESGVVLVLRHLGRLAEDLARRRLVHADRRIDGADRLEQRGDADGGELGRVARARSHDIGTNDGDARLYTSRGACSRSTRASAASSSRSACSSSTRSRTPARFSYGVSSCGHDADDLVAALEQELGEVRAVLAADAGDERLHSMQPPHVRPRLAQAERAHARRSAARRRRRRRRRRGRATAPARARRTRAPSRLRSRARAGRDRPRRPRASAGESVAIRPAAITSVDEADRDRDPGEAPERCGGRARAGCRRRSRRAASGTSVHRFSATKTSGNVDREADPREHPGREVDDEVSELACRRRRRTRCRARRRRSCRRRARTRRRPRRRSTGSPRRRARRGAPPRLGSMPRRVSGADEISAERERGRADERRGGEIRVREARDAADAELGGEAEREQVAALERDAARRRPGRDARGAGRSASRSGQAPAERVAAQQRDRAARRARRRR